MTENERPIRHYQAAGGVVTDGDRVLVLRRPGRAEVRLPKGHIDPGETAVVAALRETAEESGYSGLAIIADLGELVVDFVYKGHQIRRSERYFLMKLTPETIVASAEAQFVPAWLSWTAAQNELTFAAERTWLQRARTALADQA